MQTFSMLREICSSTVYSLLFADVVCSSFVDDVLLELQLQSSLECAETGRTRPFARTDFKARLYCSVIGFVLMA